MLHEISITNFLFLRKAHLELGKGLCVISGETGAGKSIILNAINFVLGKKLGAGYVGNNSDQASVVATFAIEGNEELIEKLQSLGVGLQDNTLILKRVITKEGKNKVFINDEACTTKLLSQISKYLIEVSGQHEVHSILNSANHQGVLDDYAGIGPELSRIKAIVNEYNNLTKEHASLLAQHQEMTAEQDYLENLIRELEALDVQEGEEEELDQKRRSLLKRRQYINSITKALDAFYGSEGIIPKLGKVERTLSINDDEEIEKIVKVIESSSLELSDAVSNLEALCNDSNIDSQLSEVEERLFGIREVARKYRVHSTELTSLLAESKQKLEEGQGLENEINKYQGLIEEQRKQYTTLASQISSLRHKASDNLISSVNNELKELKMQYAEFSVEFKKLDAQDPHYQGLEQTEFLVRTSKSQSFQPLGKVASGGELSRLLLALKVALSDVKSNSTIIFDEVDVGIGGAVAFCVGAKLAKLGEAKQVIVVTHQAQVAAYSHTHFLVKKTEAAEGTTILIDKLEEGDKELEISRMLAGEQITKASKEAALSLIESATKTSNS